MTFLFTAMFFTFVGWAIGSGYWRNIWAFAIALFTGALAWFEPYLQQFTGF